MARAPAKHRRRCPGRAPNENQTNAVLLRLAVLIRHGYSKCVDPIGPSPALQLGLPHVAFGDSGHVESGDSALDLGICPCFCTGPNSVACNGAFERNGQYCTLRNGF
jgi:hypothetical protein